MFQVSAAVHFTLKRFGNIGCSELSILATLERYVLINFRKAPMIFRIKQTVNSSPLRVWCRGVTCLCLHYSCREVSDTWLDY